MARIDSFLRLVVDQKASDLHFHAGTPPMIRHQGDLIPLPFRSLSELESRRFLLEIMSEEQREQFERDQDVDFIYEIEGVGRFRGNVFVQQRGVSGVFRVIPFKLATIDELGLPRVVKKLIKLQNGLVLVTGPTGSGKTTSLAALVHEINRTSSRHVISIEDPIEFIHEPLHSVITQRQVGDHTQTFAAALRAALREAPDVLVVGELRDVETINLALAAAETGVLVFATLHTNTAPGAVNRIIDALPEESRDQMRGALSVLLRGVIAQRLLKRSDGDGRIAALEVLLQSFAISHMIRENKVHQIEGHLQSVGNEASGQQSLDYCIFSLVRDGLVSLDEAMKAANHPDQVESMCASLPPREM